MIDPLVFRTCREQARDLLPPDVAANSFGYYIDIPDDWESYHSPEELTAFLGIHRTHAHLFNEIRNDLGRLAPAEMDWGKRYVQIINAVERLLTTTGKRPDLKHDLAETIFDWRTILKFATLPAKVLDYGAGCGRQGISAFLHHPACIYTAVDSILSAYTVQNLALSYLDTMVDQPSFVDFLDYQITGEPFPDIVKARPGDRFHVPAWLFEELVPQRFYDVIIAAHVHGELSRQDFFRLIHAIDTGLADNGLVYVRSEQHFIDPRDYFDSVDLHGIGMTDVLWERGFVAAYCKVECAFLTTVFVRKGSFWHEKAKASQDEDFCFHEIDNAHDLSARAGENFVRQHLRRLASLGLRTAVIGEGHQFHKYFGKEVALINQTKGFTEEETISASDENLGADLVAYDPKVVVIFSHDLEALEQKVRRVMANRQFPLRKHYWYPVMFMFDTLIGNPDPLFDKEVYTMADVDTATVN